MKAEIDSERILEMDPPVLKSSTPSWFTTSLKNSLVEPGEVSSPKFETGHFSTGNYSYSNSLVEEDECLSIISDEESDDNYDNTNEKTRIEETQNTMKQIRAMIPAVFKSTDPHTILVSHFSNETFFAESLVNLHENFHAQMLSARASPASLEILRSIDDEVGKMARTIDAFNGEISCVIEAYEKKDVSLFHMKDVKEQIGSLVHKYLGEELNHSINNVVDLLFEFDDRYSGEVDPSLEQEVVSLREKVTKSLQLRSESLSSEKVGQFKTVIQRSFINSAPHHDYMRELIRLMNSL